MIRLEIYFVVSSGDYETLLRTDSWLTKQMTMVAILLGGEYLQWVLRKHIISIFSRSNASYEVTLPYLHSLVY